MSERIAALLRFGALVSILLAATLLAFAQGAEVTAGTLTGSITDASGAVLAGAQVRVSNAGTGLTRQAQTDSSGSFSIPQLPAGSYTVAVEAPGFAKADVRNVEINVGSTRNLRVTMQVGKATETVQVEGGAAPLVDVSKTDVSMVIDPIQVRELPLNQRSFTALVTQQAGVVVMTNKPPASPVTARYGIGSAISVAGTGGGNVAYLQDGVSINNASQSAPGTVAGGDLPGVEATGEFKVATHNFSAAYGGAGAVVSFTTKSGSNQFHGSLYDYLRNDKLDARSYFDNQGGPKPPYRRNQFGASVGGPIRKDKTFFFANYEGLRQSLTTVETAFVPSQCARNGGVGGNLTGCPAGQTQPYPVFGPVLNTTTGFYDYQPVAISPGVKALLGLYPLAPTANDIGTTGISSVLYNNNQPIRQDFGLIHIDHNFSSRDTLFVRYAITDAVASNAFYLPTFAYDRVSRLQNLLVKWTRTIGNNVVNTASFGVMRSLNRSAIVATVPLDPIVYTGNPIYKFMGPVRVGSVSGGSDNGANLSPLANESQNPNNLVKNYFPFNDDLAIIHGAHTIKLGGMVQRNQDNLVLAEATNGNNSFNSLNDLLAGNPNINLQHTEPIDPKMYYRSTLIAWYVEDSWKARPNLTLTAGLRHEFQVPILSELHDRVGGYFNYIKNDDPTLTIGKPFNNYSLKQFQPRVGIAYDPFNTGKLVIKAGAGIFNSNIAVGELSSVLIFDTPYPVVNLVPGNPLAPQFLPPIPFPNCPDCGASTYPVLAIPFAIPIKSPTMYQWNLGGEYDLGHNFGVSLTYTGSQVRHSVREWNGQTNLACGKDANGGPIFPPACASVGTMYPKFAAGVKSFSNITQSYDGYGNYNSLTVEARRNYANGLTFNTSYTFAKAMSSADTALGAYSGQIGMTAYPGDQSVDYSEAMYSIRHRVTLNATYDLPFGRGRRWLNQGNRILDGVLGGWSLSTLGSFQSGIPFSVAAGVQISGVNDVISAPDRPNMLRSNAVVGNVNKFFDPKAYALPEAGHLGNAPRNSVRGPGFKNLDLGVRKQFRTSERSNLEFRAEFFNLLNHPNFALPFNLVYSATPGLLPDGSLNPAADVTTCNLTPAQMASYSCNARAGAISDTVGTPRQLQVSLKFTF